MVSGTDGNDSFNGRFMLLSPSAQSFLDEDDPGFAFNLSIRPFDNNGIYLRHLKMRRRLNGRCKGILDVCADPSANDFGATELNSFIERYRTF